jgi:hypothetical protein
LQKNVRAFDQLPERVLPLFAFKIEAQAFFRPVDPYEMRCFASGAAVVVTSEVAAVRAFDLDDVRTLIGQMSACQRRGDCMFQRYHCDSFKCCHVASLSAWCET